MEKKIIPIINGPNLNLLGTRQPEIYGSVSFDEYIWNLREKFKDLKIPYHQTNHEGEIIDLLHKYSYMSNGIILNAGGYTHTSIAIGDAVMSIKCPVVEVHISDIYTREKFRHRSYIKEYCIKSIVGRGLLGYDEGINFLKSN